jgi:hypothetical protein
MYAEKERPRSPFIPSLRRSLHHPCQQLQAFDEMQSGRVSIPYRLWASLAALAVGGSLVYGASLSLFFHRLRPQRSALWLALSAGGSWCIFGPLLVLLSHRRAQTCVQACLTTMAYGEAVLVSGAGINVWLHLKGSFKEAALACWNVALVGISNLVMATALTGQLRALGVPAWKTLLSWMVVLNGGGALLFGLFRRLLQGERSCSGRKILSP